MFEGGTWNMSASLPHAPSEGLDINLINTPRILELDVNRMMYGQNQVDMFVNVQLCFFSVFLTQFDVS